MFLIVLCSGGLTHLFEWVMLVGGGGRGTQRGGCPKISSHGIPSPKPQVPPMLASPNMEAKS